MYACGGLSVDIVCTAMVCWFACSPSLVNGELIFILRMLSRLMLLQVRVIAGELVSLFSKNNNKPANRFIRRAFV